MPKSRKCSCKLRHWRHSSRSLNRWNQRNCSWVMHWSKPNKHLSPSRGKSHGCSRKETRSSSSLNLRRRIIRGAFSQGWSRVDRAHQVCQTWWSSKTIKPWDWTTCKKRSIVAPAERLKMRRSFLVGTCSARIVWKICLRTEWEAVPHVESASLRTMWLQYIGGLTRELTRILTVPCERFISTTKKGSSLIIKSRNRWVDLC